jgi:hypothetical protein
MNQTSNTPQDPDAEGLGLWVQNFQAAARNLKATDCHEGNEPLNAVRDIIRDLEEALSSDGAEYLSSADLRYLSTVPDIDYDDPEVFRGGPAALSLQRVRELASAALIKRLQRGCVTTRSSESFLLASWRLGC